MVTVRRYLPLGVTCQPWPQSTPDSDSCVEALQRMPASTDPTGFVIGDKSKPSDVQLPWFIDGGRS